MTIMVFDVETIPDVDNGILVNNIDAKVAVNLSFTEKIKLLQLINRQKKQGSEFLPHYLHQIVAISVLIQDKDYFKIWSLGTLEDNEQNLLGRFFNGIEKYKPTLVSWNGVGFDLPVIHYRSLLHQTPGNIYWEVGEKLPEFKWNNYFNRYHNRHIDVMDLLSGYQKSAIASLDNISTILGFPGKMVMTGNQVLDNYLANNLKSIRDYCEIDVLNTYLIFIRLQYIRGILSETNYLSLQQILKEHLAGLNQQHFNNFLESY